MASIEQYGKDSKEVLVYNSGIERITAIRLEKTGLQ